MLEDPPPMRTGWGSTWQRAIQIGEATRTADTYAPLSATLCLYRCVRIIHMLTCSWGDKTHQLLLCRKSLVKWGQFWPHALYYSVPSCRVPYGLASATIIFQKMTWILNITWTTSSSMAVTSQDLCFILSWTYCMLWYSRFIHYFVTIAAPVHTCLQDPNEFSWSKFIESVLTFTMLCWYGSLSLKAKAALVKWHVLPDVLLFPLYLPAVSNEVELSWVCQLIN